MGFFDLLLLLNYPRESSKDNILVLSTNKKVLTLSKNEKMFEDQENIGLIIKQEILLNLLVCEKY